MTKIVLRCPQWTILLLILVTVSCGDDDGLRVLTDAQSGTEVRMSADEEFEIRLDSNPSTGYAWEVSAMTTPNLVELEATRVIAPDTELVGAGGTEIFAFTTGSEVKMFPCFADK